MVWRSARFVTELLDRILEAACSSKLCWYWLGAGMALECF